MASEANFSCFNANLSRDFLTDGVWSLDPIVETDTGTRYALTSIIFLLMLIGTPSNLLMIIVVLRKKLYLGQPTITLLLNLAVTDLLVCVLVMPWNTVSLIAGEFKVGSDDYTRCQVCHIGVVFSILSLVSLYNLTVLSMDRFIFLKAAIYYSKWVNNTRVLIATCLVWLLSVLISIPPLFGFNEMRFSTAIGICTIAFSGRTPLAKNSHYLILLAVFILVPVGVLLVTNTWGLGIIHTHLRKQRKELEKDKQTHRKSFHKKLRRKQQTLQMKLVKIYGAIFVTNVITYLPFLARLVAGLVAEEDEYSQAVRITGSLAYTALLCQSVVHPIVQASLIGEVRQGIAAEIGTLTRKIRKISSSTINTNSEEHRRKSDSQKEEVCVAIDLLDSCRVSEVASSS